MFFQNRKELPVAQFLECVPQRGKLVPKHHGILVIDLHILNHRPYHVAQNLLFDHWILLVGCELYARLGEKFRNGRSGHCNRIANR